MRNKSAMQLWKIILSLLTGRLGSDLLTFVLGLYILRTYSSPLYFGFSQVIGPLFSLILLPIKGSIIDTFNKKTILILAQLLSVISLVFYGIVTYILGFDGLILTYLLLILLNISDQFLNLGFTASIGELLIEEHVQRFKSIQQIIRAISMVLVPIASIWIVETFSLLFLIIVEIIIEMIAVLILTTIHFFPNYETQASKTSDFSIFENFVQGIAYTRKQPKLIFILLFAMIVNFLFGAINVGLPFIQVNYLNLPNNIYGITESFFALGIILSGLLLSIKTIQKPLKNVQNLLIFLGTCLILFGIVLFEDHSTIFYAIFISGFNFTIASLVSGINIPASTWMINQLPKEYHGRVFNLLNTGGELLTPLGIFTFSIFFEWLMPSIIFIVSGITLVLLTILYPYYAKIDLLDNEIIEK